MIKFLTILLLGVFVTACTNPTKTKDQKDSITKKEVAPVKNEENVNIVSGTGDGILVEISRPAILLYGKKVKSDFSKLTQIAKTEVSILLSQINNKNGVMTGSLTYVYLSKPNTGSMEVFLGIPVKAKFSNPEMGEFMEIPAQRYYKMQLNAEPGETWKQHQTMQQSLAAQHIDIHLPIMEIFSESYNSNMTPISKATLLYPVK